ncbi:MAG TPA: DUF3084 domain-containing protein [Coleofasciculaceae cyanobacterium]
MTSGYILILAILVLGGAIATLGDRIGTKVGKARLSLFNLRPRKTATVVTILTGSLISASTLGILFGLSESLRDGIFELDNILRQLRHARGEIEDVNNQKRQVERELEQTRTEQTQVQQRLNLTNRNFEQAKKQLKDVSQQAATLRSEIKSLLAERQQLLVQRKQLGEQITTLKGQVTQLNSQVTQLNSQINQLNTQVTQLKESVAQRDQELEKQDQIIAQREASLKQVERQLQEAIAQIEQRKAIEEQLKEAIAQRETRLTTLEQELAQREQQREEQEKQLAFLKREVEVLEQYYQNYQALRQGNVALLRGQVLAFGVVRIVDPPAASQAVDQLLREANRTASELTQSPGRNSDEPLVQISQAQAEQLINQIKDGQDYIVRILSAGNYLVGEQQVQVFADAALNQVIFKAGDILSAISTDSSKMTDEEIQRRIDQLLTAGQFRARRAGVLGKIQVGDGNPSSVIQFMEQLKEYNQPLDIKAVAQEVAYAAGPLKVQLVATQNGQVIFST